ncbi:MAG TPA: tetratricopeptide repeat protein [Candidatus Acidoferrales bacterium]|jgi:Flp pilus assembly protein TadD|nr:tetratricopeptide repeat protein [Candidatus Acidoferrales bacterium]
MRYFLLISLLLSFGLISSQAQQLRLPLPKKSKFTPVQQLNRDGVKALQKHDVDKAKRYFYKAYLIDPNDPFTLNNLGYVAELEGDIDRAQRYYDQAEANTSDAIVDRSTEPQDLGKPVDKIAGRTAEGPMKVNQLNSRALRLLNQDRAPEADLMLQQALKIEPNNPFSLNNMGFAKEKEGELEDAIASYSKAAQTGSHEPVVVTLNKEWRGRPISEVAAENAEKARKELARASNVEDQVARLNLRGVSAMNRNDRKAAREYFQQAYKLDPRNSFTINNMGYLAELEGDKETAGSYYEQAERARRANARVAVSTRPEAEGKPVGRVAEQSGALVDSEMQAIAQSRRQGGAPPALRTRDNRVIIDKARPANNNPDVNQPPNQEEPSEQAAPQSDQPPQLKQRTPQQNQPSQTPPNAGSSQQPPQV